MRTVCPQGHDSANSDFCDVCGTRIRSSDARDDMTGRHHVPGRFVAGDSEACPRCGATVAGQFCEACGFRVSARRPFTRLGHPGEERETSPSGRVSSGPPESLFPPISKPEPPFSAWSRPEPLPSPAGPPRPPAAPGSQSAWPPVPPDVFSAPGKPGAPEDSRAVGLLESLFSPAPQSFSPTSALPPASSRPPVRPESSPSVQAPAPSAPPTAPIPSLTRVTWTVLVASDRSYYDRTQTARGLGSAVEFPAHTSERRIRLAGKQMRIGRRSPARDVVPEIDLADRPVDPGIS